MKKRKKAKVKKRVYQRTSLASYKLDAAKARRDIEADRLSQKRS